MWGTKLIVSQSDFTFIIVFSLGKIVGTYIGDFLEKKIALGLLEIIFSAKTEKAIRIADKLRELGYTVNTRKVYGMKGHERFEVSVFIKRKEKDIMLESLKKDGISALSMVVVDVAAVQGKISTSGKKKS